MNVTLHYRPMTKLLHILSACLKEQLVTDLRRTEAKLDLDMTNTEDIFQHVTVEVVLGNSNPTVGHPCRYDNSQNYPPPLHFISNK